MPPEVLGPFGALVLLTIAVAALWRSHERTDQDVKGQRDRALAGWEAQTAAAFELANGMEKLTAAVERRDRATRREPK